MDSLTQITLGAACGEIVGGRKIGNRAMLWGAVAGTIPDLDVFIGKLMDPLADLAFHRAITHSFFFAFTFSLLLAWMIKSMYDQEWYKKKAVRYGMAGLVVIFLAFCGLIVFQFSSLASSGPNYTTIAICIVLVGLFSYRLWKNYVQKEQDEVNLDFKTWYLLIFVSTVTHPILDSFTTYGTQLFQPFSNYRVAWNNISVADPLYTIPFLGFLIWAAFLNPSHKSRKVIMWVGITLSSLYMLWTFVNKHQVNTVFEESLEKEAIEYERYMTSPSILNNILWHCVAEGDSSFYVGSYSLLDEEAIIKDMQTVPKNENLVEGTEEDHTVQTLRWFSDGYNGFMPSEDGSIQVNDLRFGGFNDDWNDPDTYIFHFNIERQEDGSFEMMETTAGPPEGDQSDLFGRLWDRIKGI